MENEQERLRRIADGIWEMSKNVKDPDLRNQLKQMSTTLHWKASQEKKK